MPTVASTLEEGTSQKEQGRKTEDLENEEKTENEIEQPTEIKNLQKAVKNINEKKTKTEVHQQKTTENKKVQSSNAVNDASDEDEDQNKVGYFPLVIDT